MNAIELLKQHHINTKTALEEMVKAEEIDSAELRLLADELVAHMMIEEHVFYPRMKEIAPDIVPEAFEEHAVARFALARALMATDPEVVLARLAVLSELIEHHVEEEEESLFPQVQSHVDAAELERLGTAMELAFDRAVEVGYEQIVVGESQELRAFQEREGAQRKKSATRTRAAKAATG